jgi:hypothetical protein
LVNINSLSLSGPWPKNSGKEVAKAVLGVEKGFQDKFFIYLVRQLDFQDRESKLTVPSLSAARLFDLN